jgi:hypothetical protein
MFVYLLALAGRIHQEIYLEYPVLPSYTSRTRGAFMQEFRSLYAARSLVIAAIFLMVGGAAWAGSSVGNEPGKAAVTLVAGATGGTGRALVRNLLAQGYQVRALVRDAARAQRVLGDEVDYRVGDVREDLALICIQALQVPAARNKTFETYSSEKPGSNDWPTMFSALQPD